MCKNAIEKFANDQLIQHGLYAKGWRFSWNRRKKSFGLCNEIKKVIQVSAYVAEKGESEEKLKDTVLHEIAHALVGNKHKHNHIWKAKARELGVRPTYGDYASYEETDYPWYRFCQSCRLSIGYYKKPTSKRRHSCPECHPGAFNEKYLLSVVPASKLEK